jgi:hypothetical protein
MTNAPHDWFAPDYYAARNRFRAAAAGAGACLSSVIHPGATGPRGRDLSMDLAVLGEGPDTLVVISGTHGPEGYPGSAIQSGLFECGEAAAIAATGVRVAMIHAHNPYGFAWDTRFNEDNIDLNRNYLADWSDLPDNPGYRALADHAAPCDRSPEAMQAAQAAIFAYAAEHGFPAMQAALTQGQYSHPQGVYFGGAGPSWSHRTIETLYRTATEGARRIVSIDVHTGLGPFGHGELIFQHEPGSALHTRVMATWDGEPCTTKDGSSVSADLVGTLDTALERFAPGAEVIAVAIEYGTVDPIEVFSATQASSWLHVFGDRDGPEAAPIRQAMRDAFYPQSAEWREKVWARGLDVVRRGLRAFAD